MSKQVSNRQLFFIIFIITIGYSSMQIAETMASAVGTNAWAAILFSGVIFSFGAFVVCFLGNKYREKTLFEYSQIIVGKPLTYVITFIYIIYYFSLLAFVCLNSAGLIKDEFLPNTPLYALIAMFLLVCGFAASKGLQNIGRIIEYLGTLIFIGAMVILISLCFQGDFLNILPIFDPSKLTETFSAFPKTILYFIGSILSQLFHCTKKTAEMQYLPVFLQ